MHTKYHSSHEIGVPQSALLRKRMVQGGLLRVSTKDPGTRTLLLPPEEARRHSLITPDFVVFRKKKPALLGARKHLSELNPTFINVGKNDHEQLTTSTKTEVEKGQDPNFLPKKRHFRESEEWKKKRSRIIAKIRTMGRLNLALIMARMPLLLIKVISMAAEQIAVPNFENTSLSNPLGS
uniref:Uncharacterized protein n=1 Tax=Panagrolaimus sp. ES5 TaxID=591445 RepID=A0AC34GRI9_9BILA